MWVLGFALGGCEWALKKASSPEFDLRGKMIDYNRRRKIFHTTAYIDRLENKIAELKAELLPVTKVGDDDGTDIGGNDDNDRVG